MMRFTKCVWTSLLLLLAVSWHALPLRAHDPRHSGLRQVSGTEGAAPGQNTISPSKLSGQGAMRFRVLYTSSELPEAALKVLTSAHGGFAIDRREGRGECYFAFPGAGILQISADLKRIQSLNTPAEMKDVNLHSATLWTAPDGTPYLVFAANDAGKVFTTTLEGQLVSTLNTPTAEDDFDNPTVNNYFVGGGNFAPTDVEELDGLYYVTTGYSNLDFVLTARILRLNPFKAVWHPLAFGGRGTGQGQFGTAHGITVPPGTHWLDISDRPNSKIDRFTRYGQYLSTLKMPNGSLPCDINFCENYAIVPCLDGPDRRKGAPIYILEGQKIISAIFPKDDLGLANFKHVHNAVLRKIGDKFYIIAQAWNPGDFVILEQVSE